MYDEWSDLFIAKNELNEPNSLTVKKIIGPSENKIFFRKVGRSPGRQRGGGAA